VAPSSHRLLATAVGELRGVFAGRQLLLQSAMSQIYMLKNSTGHTGVGLTLSDSAAWLACSSSASRVGSATPSSSSPSGACSAAPPMAAFTITSSCICSDIAAVVSEPAAGVPIPTVLRTHPLHPPTSPTSPTHFTLHPLHPPASAPGRQTSPRWPPPAPGCRARTGAAAGGGWGCAARRLPPPSASRSAHAGSCAPSPERGSGCQLSGCQLSGATVERGDLLPACLARLERATVCRHQLRTAHTVHTAAAATAAPHQCKRRTVR
jgi:hypothetical protein